VLAAEPHTPEVDCHEPVKRFSAVIMGQGSVAFNTSIQVGIVEVATEPGAKG
jgi:hypothetical protein